ncbi:MAG TPA: radical SAM protein [Hadesarchaea archaeon]|nr:radical SAM protein [Hadesarchaea archaeon]
MENMLPARFQVCKHVGVGIDLSASDEELWSTHERGLKKFRKLLADVDKGKTKLKNLKQTEPSLLDLKVELAKRILRSCHFCERRCGVDRTEGEKGTCGVGERSRVASEFMHHGEEPELVPSYTIFFNGCTFKCCLCQNWDISQDPKGGVEVSPQTLAKLIEANRREGARNVNWVGGEPTPNLHVILAALNECKTSIPSVWNSNFFMSLESMKLLFGTQDVFLTDLKYGNDACALRYSKVNNYWEVVTRNHRLAYADAELIIRHLVLPNNVECCTRPVLEWIARNLGSTARTNIMPQFRPEYKAREFEELRRRTTADEMDAALKIAREVGLENVIS